MQTALRPVRRPDTIYRVVANDSLPLILRRFGIPYSRLAELFRANPRKVVIHVRGQPRFRDFRIGDLIAIPVEWLPGRSNQTGLGLPTPAATYTVQAGDSLPSILQKMRVPYERVSELFQANPRLPVVTVMGQRRFRDFAAGQTFFLPTAWLEAQARYMNKVGTPPCPPGMVHLDARDADSPCVRTNALNQPGVGAPRTSYARGAQTSPYSGVKVNPYRAITKTVALPYAPCPPGQFPDRNGFCVGVKVAGFEMGGPLLLAKSCPPGMFWDMKEQKCLSRTGLLTPVCPWEDTFLVRDLEGKWLCYSTETSVANYYTADTGGLAGNNQPGVGAVRASQPKSFYTVQPGDTLVSIAAKFGQRPERIWDLSLLNKQKLRTNRQGALYFLPLVRGEKLWIPNPWVNVRGQTVGVGDSPWECTENQTYDWSDFTCKEKPYELTICGPGQHPSGGACLPDVVCGAGFHADFSGTVCLPNDPAKQSPGAVPKNGPTCPQGYIDDPLNPAEFCILDPNVDTTCPAGQVWDVFYQKCVNINCEGSLDPYCKETVQKCPYGQHLEDGKCVNNATTVCPTGQFKAPDGTCKLIPIGGGGPPVQTVPPIQTVPPQPCPDGFVQSPTIDPTKPNSCLPISQVPPVAVKKNAGNGLVLGLLAGAAALGVTAVVLSKQKKKKAASSP